MKKRLPPKALAPIPMRIQGNPENECAVKPFASQRIRFWLCSRRTDALFVTQRLEVANALDAFLYVGITVVGDVACARNTRRELSGNPGRDFAKASDVELGLLAFEVSGFEAAGAVDGRFHFMRLAGSVHPARSVD